MKALAETTHIASLHSVMPHENRPKLFENIGKAETYRKCGLEQLCVKPN